MPVKSRDVPAAAQGSLKARQIVRLESVSCRVLFGYRRETYPHPVTTNRRTTGLGGKRKQGAIPREDRDLMTSLLPIQPVPLSSGDHAPVPVDVLPSSLPASTLVMNRRLSRGGRGGAPRLDTLIPSEALFSTPKVLTRSTADNQDGSGRSGHHNLQPGSLRGTKGIIHEVSTNEPKPLLDKALPPPPAKQANYAAPVSYAMNGAYPMPIKKLPQHAAPAPIMSRKGPLIFAAMVQAEDPYPSPPAEYPLDPVPQFMMRALVMVTVAQANSLRDSISGHVTIKSSAWPDPASHNNQLLTSSCTLYITNDAAFSSSNATTTYTTTICITTTISTWIIVTPVWFIRYLMPDQMAPPMDMVLVSVEHRRSFI
ncbi:hypothetical protein EDD85DRAFT_794348 [Armillaria nabsnona]|nr:hypothetical protein EDD85DRAFT_794348 [Armillaria nabsnona]